MIAESILCIALNVYFEARSEELPGKVAVGSVVMNRVESPIFPDTACEVVYQAEYIGVKKDGPFKMINHTTPLYSNQIRVRLGEGCQMTDI